LSCSFWHSGYWRRSLSPLEEKWHIWEMSQLNLQLVGFIFILRVFNQACTMVDMSEEHSQINRRLHISVRVTSTPLHCDSPTCSNRETWCKGNVAIQQTKLSFPLYVWCNSHSWTLNPFRTNPTMCVFTLHACMPRVFRVLFILAYLRLLKEHFEETVKVLQKKIFRIKTFRKISCNEYVSTLKYWCKKLIYIFCNNRYPRNPLF